MRRDRMREWVVGALFFTLVLSVGPLDGQVGGERITRAARLLEELVETYGVSGDEGEVRDVVLSHLPDWAEPEVDSAGNVWVRVGEGGSLSVFVAHMDEVGYQITEIGDDGMLTLRARGGFLPWLWEGTPALVHKGDDPVNGVFVPREDTSTPARQSPDGAARVDVGARSRGEVEAMGAQLRSQLSCSAKDRSEPPGAEQCFPLGTIPDNDVIEFGMVDDEVLSMGLHGP